MSNEVALTGTLGGQREFLYARPGRYVASQAIWVEIETAIAYGDVVRVGPEPSSVERPVSIDDPETLLAVTLAVPGFSPDAAPPELADERVAIY